MFLDDADEPRNLEDACPSHKHGEAVPGKIRDLVHRKIRQVIWLVTYYSVY